MSVATLSWLCLGPADHGREGQRWEAPFPSPRSSPDQGSAPRKAPTLQRRAGEMRGALHSVQWLPDVRRKSKNWFFNIFFKSSIQKKLLAGDGYVLGQLLGNSWCWRLLKAGDTIISEQRSSLYLSRLCQEEQRGQSLGNSYRLVFLVITERRPVWLPQVHTLYLHLR